MKRFLIVAVSLLVVLGCSKAEHAAWQSNLALKESGSPHLLVANATQQQPLQEKGTPRKIIYTGGVDLIVGDFAGATSRLDTLVAQYGGLLAQSEINSDPGAPRFGTWRVRIPVERFKEFVNEVARLGEPLKNKTDSEDITDKYFDFQVRIENKKVQVERLQKIIKEETGKISEVLEAERELGRVTTELEELKGTVKLWDNQTALATVNITMRENTRYVPPEAPSFASSVSHTFKNSVEALVSFSQAVALVIVAITPWLPVIAVVVLAFWLAVRRARHIPRPGA